MKLSKIISLALSAVMLFTLAGCGSSDSSGSSKNSSGSDSATITITDHAGYEVEVPKNIERIAVTDIYPVPSVLTIFFDSADKLVGIAPASMTAAKNSLLGELYPEILNADTGFFDGTNINVEELIALDPDIVIYSAESPAMRGAIESAGIPAVAISASKWDYNAVETLDNWLDLLGQMFPENDKAELCKKESEEMYDMVTDRLSAVSDEDRLSSMFLFQYSESAIAIPGNTSFGNWWAGTISTDSVTKDLPGANGVQVNMEQIYEWNPEILFITNFNSAQTDDIYNNTFGNFDWSGISAVQNKRVYKMPLGMYRSYTPGIDTPITLLWMSKTAYPELFSDIDVTNEAISYYKEAFGIDLTKEQVERIFAPVSEASAW